MYIITLMVNLTKNYYKYYISFIRTNSELALGYAFTTLLTNYSIKYKETSYYTPKLNG